MRLGRGIVDRLVEHLHADLRPLYRQLIQDLAVKDIKARLIEGFRSNEYQSKLIKKGASKVQNSKHCFTLLGQPAAKAFDIGCFNRDGSYVTDGEDIRYSIAGDLWKQYARSHPDLKLVWGGSWNPPDYDHFQIE